MTMLTRRHAANDFVRALVFGRARRAELGVVTPTCFRYVAWPVDYTCRRREEEEQTKVVGAGQRRGDDALYACALLLSRAGMHCTRCCRCEQNARRASRLAARCIFQDLLVGGVKRLL